MLQMEKAKKLDIDEAVYYDIIRQKTARDVSVDLVNSLERH